MFNFPKWKFYVVIEVHVKRVCNRPGRHRNSIYLFRYQIEFVKFVHLTILAADFTPIDALKRNACIHVWVACAFYCADITISSSISENKQKTQIKRTNKQTKQNKNKTKQNKTNTSKQITTQKNTPGITIHVRCSFKMNSCSWTFKFLHSLSNWKKT